jgi:hypothetical protein
VWTGTEFLIHGPYYTDGAGLRSVGAAYNPATNTWRRIPVTPDPPEMKEARQVAVWTGTDMLTWGMVDAAYRPATNTWRRLPPGYGSPAVAVWTGRQALLWGGGSGGEVNRGGVAYDPVTGAMQTLPEAPFGGPDASGVWTGKELVVVGLAEDARSASPAAAYNPATRSWRSLSSMPSSRLGGTVTWTGREVLVVGGLDSATDTVQTDGDAYSPAVNRWRHLPVTEYPRWNHVAVWTGRQLLVWGGRVTADPVPGTAVTPPHGAAYDPGRNRWSALPRSPLDGRDDAVAVWTGRKMIVWGGDRVTPPYGVLTDGAAFRP